MQVSVDWLREYVPVTAGADELARQLTMGGVEVDRIVDRSHGMAGIVTGRIVELEPHPHADKLLLCRIDVGKQELVTIVTAAANVFIGAVVPTALAGAKLPTGQLITEQDFRGIVSAGMLCSGDELGIDKKLVAPDLREGIYVLPHEVEPGQDMAMVLGLGSVLELDLTPNRSDCLSLLGVAYELAALTEQKITWPQLFPLSYQKKHPEIEIEIAAPDLCPGYLGLLIKDVKIGPSPLWMQNRLQSVGMRPINNIVDITNYVLMELGQPLHAFDLDKIEEQKICVRRAEANEEIRTLDEENRILDREDLVIADGRKAVAIAGVMGSQEAEVTMSTKNVLIESALFDYKSVRRTSRRLGLRTDASSRFDKGVDPGRVQKALERTAWLVASLGLGQPQKIAVGQVPPVAGPTITLRPRRVEQILGMAIEKEEMLSFLARLGLEVDAAGETWQVAIPTRRPDLNLEIDLIEEIARFFGYNNIPAGKMQVPLMRGSLTEEQLAEQRLRRQLLGLGLTEILTLAFVDPREVARLVEPDHSWNQGLKLQNPLSVDRSFMRPSLLFGILNTLGYNNARQQQDMAIFEIANVFVTDAANIGEQPDEILHLGLACMGEHSLGWQGPGLTYDFFYLKGIIETIYRSFGIDNLLWQRADTSFLHPKRSATIYLNDIDVGFIGELHPDVAITYGLKPGVIVAELSLNPLFANAVHTPTFKGIPKYPAIARDLAIVVDRSLSSSAVTKIIEEVAGDLLVDVNLFDVYQGEQIMDNKKSLAYSLVFQSMSGTLLDDEIADLHGQIVKELQVQVGARLR